MLATGHELDKIRTEVDKFLNKWYNKEFENLIYDIYE